MPSLRLLQQLAQIFDLAFIPQTLVYLGVV